MSGAAARVRSAFAILLLAAAVLAAGRPARSEVAEVRIAKQFSMGYIQLNVMDHEKLIEKHAAAAGLGPVKLAWLTFNGPDMMNDALLSGAVDLVCGGVPGLVTIWAKTKGTAQEVRGVSALAHQPILLNTRSTRIRTIRDYAEGDRIAVPAVKVSIQAILLQMAAAKEWGEASYNRLDRLTFSMSPVDATTGLVTGNSEFESAFTVPPFQHIQLKKAGVHTVLSSEDIVGPSTSSVIWTSRRFHDANPKLYGAILAALREASDFIAANPRKAAEYWVGDSKSPISVDELVGFLGDPRFKYTTVPERTMVFGDFMAKVGSIKTKPESWRDLFFPEIHDVAGS
jgi:NitT/TauT family transport system substrate-binding protein